MDIRTLSSQFAPAKDTFAYKALHLGNSGRGCTTTAPESVHRLEHLSALVEASGRRRRLYIRCIVGVGVGVGTVEGDKRARAVHIERVELSQWQVRVRPFARSVGPVAMMAHLAAPTCAQQCQSIGMHRAQCQIGALTLTSVP